MNFVNKNKRVISRAEFEFMLSKHGEATIKKYASSTYEDTDVVVYSMPFFEMNKYLIYS